MILWAATMAWAQSEQPAPPEVDDEPVMEITVWGTLAVQQAEGAIIQEMKSLGYRAKRSDGRVIFKPEVRYKGAAILEDGVLTFRRPVAGWGPTPEALWDRDSRWRTTAVGPDGRPFDTDAGATATLWVLPSQRKLDTYRAEVRTALADELAHYHAVVARTELEERLVALPDELDALWETGTPLEGLRPMDTPAERRNHALAYWATRPDSASGRRVSEAVAAWLGSVVQHSEHPITEDERRQWSAERPDLRLPR
ncbi:MAG: hypothetical protein KTR31_28450 [Myxococcales bacterium]|nr:hypothetical protein [Myxococcales bacterium]